MPEGHFRLIDEFRKIREKLAFPTDKLLVTCRGNDFTDILEPLSKKLGKPVTYSAIRKEVETKSFLIDGNESKSKDQISSYLCHSKETAAKFYKFKNDEAVVEESLQVSNIIFQLAATEVVARDRILPRTFTETFPSKDSLGKSVEQALRYTSIRTLPLSSASYNKVRANWLESFRDKAVIFYSNQMAAARCLHSRDNVKKMIENSVWSKDVADITCMILENLSGKKLK
ncbi:hypothetical protein FOCC_FOCC010981 [Frankliniella occidentalis]|uniref:Uncharacterized protein LOC127750086 n=1 Tax=Frankliniella occidentalis TaxID=133901 RepID=A0A9C6WYB3_FRAOC|nr:uncharacterized protein LOC127750086 [Frankliniella occidentalis]KAE8743410.1 hypothetical protein FOCC_FOCC010981 [Frankliniella occidentalis]